VAIAARYKGYRYPIEVIGHAVWQDELPLWVKTCALGFEPSMRARSPIRSTCHRRLQPSRQGRSRVGPCCFINSRRPIGVSSGQSC
jgi:hypothetical protein